MDACLPDWNTDLGAEFHPPLQRKPLGLQNELVELLWQNGEIVLHNQTNRKQSCDDPCNKSKQIRDPTSLIQDDETSLWIDCPIDESFERDFCSDFLSDLPSFDESQKPDKFDPSEVNHVVPTSYSQHQEFVPLPPLRFQAKKQGVEHESSCMSRMTVGSSNCASNHVMDVSWASSCGIGAAGEAYARSLNKGADRETYGQAAATSFSGGSGSSLWRTRNSQSNDTNKHKRKSRELEESEFPSDATESESAAGNKATTRRTRVAEVHNHSEKKRRDRINEKMKALQELIPHSNKSDKASMLDEAIEYMKSLQLKIQLQLMWMGRGRGMGPMMFPGMHPCTPRGGMATLPPFQTQMQNYMALYSMPNNTCSPQATNVFNLGLQQNEVAAPKTNGSKSVG